ncbi:hypothetical protein PC114_g14440 [Phytophthora cactorum]|nr:hypothetical protein PC114_g14440 [Phytophthora cactorum]
MPSTPQSTKKQRQHQRAAAKARVVRAFKEGANWREVAAHNDVPYSTARRAVLNADGEPTTHVGVRGVRVKMTMEVMGKLEHPMSNPIEGCWNVLKAKMRRFMAERKEEFLVRGEYETFCAHRRALMEEAVEFAKPAITRRLVWRMERHCLKASFAAGRGEDMELGK